MTTDIGRALVQLERRIAAVERQSRLASASLDDTALEVRDGNGSLRGIVGQQGDGTTAVNVVNGPPPPAPSAPIVVSVLGGVTVSWDGQFANGAVMPLDWARVEVHASPLASYTPTAETLKATVETAQGCTVVIATPDPVYVQLVARSTSGTPSDPSVTVGPVGPTAVVASDILDGIVTTVKLADDAVTQAKVAVGAIGTTEISDSAITTPKIVAGAVQTAQLDAEAVNASKIAAGAVTTAKLDALAVTANELAANAVTASKILAGSVSAQALTIGIAQSIVTKLTDTMADSSTWARVAETGTFATVTGVTDSVAGSTVLEVTGPTSIERTENIPYDSSALYRVTVRLRTTTAPTAGNPNMYVGLTGIAADGTTRVNINGANSVNSQHYIAASGLTVAVGTAWTTVTGYIQGTAATGTTTPRPDPRTPGVAHTSVRYVRPFLRVLFGATGGVMQVDQVTVETVPTGAVNSVNIVDGAVTADAIAANTITAVKLAAGSVDATALKADAITGKVITGGTINGTDINGATVTGGVVRTGSTGERVVITPTPPAPMVQRATVLMYSGAADEIGPGLMNSGVLSSRPNTVVASPATAVDSLGTPVRSTLSLSSPNPGTRKGQFILNAIAPNISVDVGYAYVDGSTATDASGASAVIIAAKDGATTPKLAQLTVTNGRVVADAEAFQIAPTASTAQSAIYVNSPTTHTGNLLRLQHNGVDEFVVDNSGNATVGGNATVTGTLTAGNIAFGQTSVTPSAAYTPTSTTVFYSVTGTTFRGFATLNSTVPGYRTPATPSMKGVTGVSVSSVTATSMMVWVNREDTTATNINWMVMSS
ncbi:hypothetical protein [Streptomyces sp. NPDC056192]|uniref:hypothetical protein n=1 Tax=Streptomyces sp. NPDC056192 TaxID=3345743 RepID=UPI0035DD7A5D